MEECYERSLLPFYIRLDISCVDVLPVSHRVICSNEVLACKVFPALSSLGARCTSLKEYAAANEGCIEGYAGDGGDFLVGYDVSDHLFPDLSSIPILVFLLDFHDFRKNI